MSAGADNEILSGILQNKTVSELVLGRLKRDIITGRLAPGTRLVERDLTEQLQVSRTPLREALRQLERNRLVVRIPYRGVFVRNLSLEEAREVYDLRIGIEGIAAYLAAERATRSELFALEATFARIDEMAESGDKDEVMVLNTQFHKQIAEATRNRLLQHQIDDLWANIHLVRVAAWRGDERARRSRDEHAAILEALLRRDAEGSRRAAEAHIRSSWRAVEEAMRSQDPVLLGGPWLRIGREVL